MREIIIGIWFVLFWMANIAFFWILLFDWKDRWNYKHKKLFICSSLALLVVMFWGLIFIYMGNSFFGSNKPIHPQPKKMISNPKEQQSINLVDTNKIYHQMKTAGFHNLSFDDEQRIISGECIKRDINGKPVPWGKNSKCFQQFNELVVKISQENEGLALDLMLDAIRKSPEKASVIKNGYLITLQAPGVFSFEPLK